jgi:hypothetical protein
LAILGVCLLVMVLSACAASEAPVRSPLDDPSTPAPGAGTPLPLPTFTATPDAPVTGTPGAPTPSPADGEERIAGLAIDALAEWLGMAPTDFALHSIEAVQWPSSCLGVERPDFACAEVITPGYRIILRTFGGATEHHVHANTTGRLVWAPTFENEGRIVAVDASAGRVTVEVDGGRAEYAAAPGSQFEPALTSLAPGMGFSAGLDRTPTESAVVVWFVAR